MASKKKTEIVPDKVQQAVQQLREAHKLGLQLLGDCGRRSEYAQNSIALAAEKHGISEEKARKLRQFADPGDGYTLAALEELCRLCVKHETALGISIVYKFLSVPKQRSQRARFQRRAITQGWSRAQVVAELGKKYGKRRRAGRTPEIPEDTAGQVIQILQRCEQWLRWTSSWQQKSEDATGTGQRALFPELTDQLRKNLIAVNQTMSRLRDEAARETDS